MTRQIERTLNLPKLEDAIKSFTDKMPEIEAENKKADKMAADLEKISPIHDQARMDEGTDVHCREMDDVYRQALRAHKEMLELGFNVESRHSGSIFEPAARFLEIAMTASKSKSEQKLKTIKLRMDREKLEFDIHGLNITEATIDPNDSSSFVADRNDLLKDLVGKLRDSRVPKK